LRPKRADDGYGCGSRDADQKMPHLFAHELLAAID
jgi:hypothetical protein